MRPLSGTQWALAVTALVAVVVTWPLALDPGGALSGHPGNDVWNHIWGYWWVADELGKGHLPLRTDLQHFPQSSRLFFIDTFGAVLTLPLQWIAGPVVALNVVVIGCFWAAGMSAWALARHVRAELFGAGPDADRDALVAAVAYATAPHLVAQAYNGISETLFAFGLPLATLGVLRLLDRPTTWNALLAAGAMALCTLANWYYGLFAIVGSAILLVVFAATRRERIRWGALPRTLALAGIVTGAAVAPVLAGFASTLDGPDAIVQRDPEFVWTSLVTHNITDVVSAFVPGKVYSPDLKALHGEELLIVTYLGWTLLVLAGAGLLRMRRWRDRAPWLVWIGVFGLLMLGPYLYVAGEYVTVTDRRIPLPFLAMFESLPLFERISHPFRFVMGVQLGLGVLAAVGLGALPRPARYVAIVLLAAEALLASPAPWPLPRSDARIPESVAVLAADPVPGAVLDLPISVPNLERAVYLYWQTGHGRPSPYALNEPLPGVLDRSHLARALLVAEAGRLDRLPPMVGELDLVVAGRALARLGVRWVVMHESLYPPERREQTLILLRAALGPETQTTGDGRHLWLLAPPAGDEEPTG
ncbi:MAG: hypothetical protein Q8P41_15065 [Pseudomonadota bacterium]|nr:hypothetical protein [Pseudomonadota bacterium]